MVRLRASLGFLLALCFASALGDSQQLLKAFPTSTVHYDIRPLINMSVPSPYCQYRCGPYSYAMDLVTTTKEWYWNDTTPLGFQIINATFLISAAFCPLNRLGNISDAFTFVPRFNSRTYGNVTLNNPWCTSGLTLINLTKELDPIDRSLPVEINHRSANKLALEVPTLTAYAMVEYISLDLVLADLRPKYTLTKSSYPYLCGTDLTIRVMAVDVSPLVFYMCDLKSSITTMAVNISGNDTSILYECTFSAEVLDIYSFCETMGNWAVIQFFFYPSPEFGVDFPYTYIDIYFNPQDLGVIPSYVPYNQSTLIYLTSNMTFLNMDEMKVFWNGTVIPSLFINDSHVLAKVPPSPIGESACLSIALNGIDQVPEDCSLNITYGDGVYKLPPQWPDPFLPPRPPAEAPLEPSGYESFEEFSRTHWYIYVIVGGMAGILALTVACIRRNSRLKSPEDGGEYRPLGNFTEVDIDPKLYVSSKEIKLVNLIGHGSFASVHKGAWRGTIVAVKKLHPHMRESSMSDFIREAALMLNLRHPNIVALMGLSRDEETFSIITEYLDRGSLDDILHNAAIIIEPEHVRLFALDAAKGMTYLHAAGVLHRDLKCGNLLVDKDWNVKVADFGLSRDNDAADATMTACGTPSWAAPEVIRHQKYSFKADVFSFGICLWEMSTRSKPYEDIPPYQVVIAVAMKGLRPKLSSKIHKSFMRLMVQCWDDRAEVRPSFLEIAGILEEMQCPHPVNDFPIDPNDPVTRSRLRKSSQSISTPTSPSTERIATSMTASTASNKATNVSPPTLTVDTSSQGAAPAVPELPSPLESDTPRYPFANSPPSPLGSPSNSGSHSQSRSPSSGEATSIDSKQKATSPKFAIKRDPPKAKKKKNLAKFAAYAVSAPSHTPNAPPGRLEAEDQRVSPSNSLPTITESQEQPEPKPNQLKTSTNSNGDFVISL